jgi:regulator of replication initiation timing
MAEDVIQLAEVALNKIVTLTNESGNLKKELRKLIHENVSSLRNLIYTLKDNLRAKSSENHQLQNEVREMKEAWKVKGTRRWCDN